MNSDPNYQRLRETAWRRPLTESEQAEMRDWLGAHPEAQAEAELEMALDQVLALHPAAPVPSNFTARVLQAIEHPVPRSRPSAGGLNWWQIFIPRFAAVALVALVSLLGYRQYRTARQAELTVAARQLATARALSDPVVIEDFELIRNLSPSFAVDESLLALSDDLMALDK